MVFNRDWHIQVTSSFGELYIGQANNTLLKGSQEPSLSIHRALIRHSGLIV